VHKDLVLAGSPAEAAAADVAATCRRGELEAAAAAGFVLLRAEPGRTATGGRCGSCSGDAVVAAGDAVAAAESVGVAAAVVEWSQEWAGCRWAAAKGQHQLAESNGLAALSE